MYTLGKLNNGLKYILAPLSETEAVTVLVLVKVGSRNESVKLNGISHFIEHLLFKGTVSRPTSLDISKELDGVGADYNAFTAKDHTGYYIKVNREHLELAMEIVSDMLFNSLFESGEIAKERGVIIEEINMYEDNPMMRLDSEFEELVFQGHPLSRKISGPKENIQKIQRRELIGYFKKHYLSGKVVIGLSGKFKLLQGKQLIAKYFGQSIHRRQPESLIAFKNRQNKPQVKLIAKETEQVHLAIGYPAVGLFDPALYPLVVLATILGGNMSSRLFTEVREKQGLAYYIRASMDAFADTGVLGIFAGLDKNKIDLAIKTILNELRKITQEAVSQEELSRAKEYLKGKLILRLEDSAEIIHWLAGQQLLKGRIEKLSEHFKKIEGVSVQAVQAASARFIKTAKINLAAIGPFKNKEKFLNIIKQ